jgi:hypothetical protein
MGLGGWAVGARADGSEQFNIIRYLLDHQKVQLTLVPYDYDLEKNPEGIECVAVLGSSLSFALPSRSCRALPFACFCRRFDFTTMI